MPLLSSLNTVFCVNGGSAYQILLDSGAAVSEVNLDSVRDKLLNQVNICAVGANGTPLDVVSQITATVHLHNFKVEH